MAGRRWGGSIATAVGVAAGTGAAQLGFGYGLGIINWAATDAAAGDQTAWVASLAWATWIAGTSTIAGAASARYLRHRHTADDGEPSPADPHPANPQPADPQPTDPRPAGPATVAATTGGDGPSPAHAGPGRGGDRGFASAALALAGGLGALVTVLLVAVPARMAAVPDVSTPQAVAAAYAGVGVLIGVLMAGWVLRSPAAAANVIATIGWLWLLAVVAVVDGVLSGRGLTTAQLGIWQLSGDRSGFWLQDWFYWPGALLALASALLIGALAARRAARSPQHRLGAAASGAAGPLLVALAYLLATPGLADIGRAQVSAHLVAPYAVVAGLAGSMLTAALAQRATARRTGPAPQTPALGVGAQAAIPRQRGGESDDAPHRPTASQPDASQAGTTEAGTTKAGTAEPGTTEAGTTQAGTTEAGTSGPGGAAVAEPGGAGVTAEPGGAEDLPEGGSSVAAERRPATTPKPRAGRRAR
ncbi:hypothetical protein [Micromonospora sp. DT233]|uniref:hypothetical protein n=1 Tax=Micromonospora sp. DT233 TaxID=3393432 RepID=UPI003CF31758